MANVKKENSKDITSAFDLLGKSYHKVKANWQAFAVVNAFALLGAIGNAFTPTEKASTDFDAANPSYFSDFTGVDLGLIAGTGFVLILIFLAVAFLLFSMMVSLEVKVSSGKSPSINEIFEDGKKNYFRLLGLVIVLFFTIGVGLLLLILPGLFALGRLVMSPYHMVDKDIGITEALKKSNNQAKENMLNVYTAIGVLILVSFAASLLDVIPIIGPITGVLITIAFSLVLVLRYQQLKGVKV